MLLLKTGSKARSSFRFTVLRKYRTKFMSLLCNVFRGDSDMIEFMKDEADRKAAVAKKKKSRAELKVLALFLCVTNMFTTDRY